ncbi:MAG: hypothetical protein ABL932_25845 [Terricaulis sp.]
MTDFQTLSEAAAGPDVWLSVECYYIFEGGSCSNKARFSIVYLIATRGPDWTPSRQRFVCTHCGAKANFGFGHPKWPFGQGHGEMPMTEYHRRVSEARWNRYVNPGPYDRRYRPRHSPAWC